jgi:O-antigen/teichoic acid export membrane protein
MNALTSTAVPLQNLGRRFVLNLSFGMVGKLTHFTTGIFLIAYVVRRLGPERYGLIVIATTAMAFLGLIQAGASAGLGRLLNVLHTRGEKDEFRKYFSAGTLLSLGLVGVIAVGLLGVLTVLWPGLNVPFELRREGHWVVGLLGCGLILSCLTLPALACYQAIHRVDLMEKIGVGGTVLRAAATVALFEWVGAAPALYAVALLVEQMVVFSVSWIFLRNIVPEARLSLQGVTRGTFREIAGFNFLNLLANVNYVAFMQAPAFVLQRFEGLAVAGLYGIGLQLNNLVRGFLSAAMNAVSPAAISLHATGNAEQLRKLFLLTTKCFTALAALLWVLFLFLGESFLTLWLNRDVAPLVAALPWLIAASALGVAAMPASVFALTLGRLRLSAIAGVLLAAVMTGCMVGLGGSEWQPALTRISLLLAIFFGIYQVVRIVEIVRLLKVSVRELVGPCLRSSVPALLATAALAAVGHWRPETSHLQLAGVTLLALLAGGAGVVWVLFSKEEQCLLKRLGSAVRIGAAKN